MNTAKESDTEVKMCQKTCFVLKDGLSLNIKKIHIHLYFIAIQYFCNYALVEDIDN